MTAASYQRYLLAVLMLLLAFNQLDRLALGIVLQDIKVDLALNDTQLGFLSGIAFAAFYATMGIPIALWADRGNRVTIISITAALWSVAVASCSFATSFLQLVLLRMVVGVGEAGCMPPALSLIADEFSRNERPRAVSRYMLGVPIAFTAGYAAAGWLNDLYGWRTTFVILGVPGIALAVLTRLSLREPRKLTAALARSEPPPRLMEVFATLASSPAFRHLLMSFSVWFFFAYGIVGWLPAFFIRSHGMGTSELGLWFALVWGVGGGLGIWLSGELVRRFAAGDEERQLRGCAIALSFFAPVAIFALLTPSHYLAFAALTIAAFGGNMAQSPMFAATQTLVEPRMRAMAIAVIYLFANLIGMGIGPVVAGMLSDALQPRFGDDSLRYALVLLCPGYFWAGWHLWRASKTIARDHAKVAEGVVSAAG